MPNLDKGRLIKLLNLTASDTDGEALGAIRRANAALRKAKTSWEEVVNSGQEPEAEAPLDFTFDPALREHSPTVMRPPDPKEVARARVRSVPVLVRLAFFPVWATAEAYITASMGERWPMKGLTLSAPLLVAAMTGSAWVYGIRGVARSIL